MAETLLPDLLRYDPTRPASFPDNGRTLTDDVSDAFLAILTNGKVTEDKVGPHGDLLDEFPYLGRRTIRRLDAIFDELTVNNPPKTVIVTGASQGIGAGIVKAFLARGYDVVGTARSATKSKELSASDHLALIDGDIGQFETAQKVAELAIKKFGSIDAVVANAGIFLVKPFTEYTADDFRALVSTNLAGFIYITQLAVKQMQAQKTGGSIVSITAALVDNPIAGVTRFPFHDHQRWSERRHAKPGDGIRERAYSIQRRRSRGRRHTASRRRFERFSENAFADGHSLHR